MNLPPALFQSLDIAYPLVQAPMAGSMDAELVIAAAQAGALGSLPCAMLDAAQIESEVARIRAATDRPFNLNFFCHREPALCQQTIATWRQTLAPYYAEAGVNPPVGSPSPGRQPFDEEKCQVVERLQPAVVSFHFGLPDEPLLARVKATGARIFASATSVAEAIWLEQRGVDAVIAQGLEAGGHRGMFLTDTIATQPATLALTPQVVDAIKLPVIAAGGISDRRAVVAVSALGACAVQVGTAFLFSREAKPAPCHRHALDDPDLTETALTNLFSGRPARGIVNRLMRELGPMNPAAPPFPLAGNDLIPLKTSGKIPLQDISPLWCGQAVGCARRYIGFTTAQIIADLMGFRL